MWGTCQTPGIQSNTTSHHLSALWSSHWRSYSKKNKTTQWHFSALAVCVPQSLPSLMYRNLHPASLMCICALNSNNSFTSQLNGRLCHHDSSLANQGPVNRQYVSAPWVQLYMHMLACACVCLRHPVGNSWLPTWLCVTESVTISAKQFGVLFVLFFCCM